MDSDLPSDLEGRIEALEAEIAQLRLQVAQKQPGITIAPHYVPYPNDWYRPPVVWCDTTSNTVVHVGRQTSTGRVPTSRLRDPR